MVSVDHLVADPRWNRNFDEMLICRQLTVVVNQLFQHGSRIMLRRINYAEADGVPSACTLASTAIIPYGKLALSVSNAVSGERFR